MDTWRNFQIAVMGSEERDLLPRLQLALDLLGMVERNILVRRWGLLTGQQATLEATGKVFGLTRERTRQVEAKAIDQLKVMLGITDGR